MKRNSLVFFLVFSLICVAAADERAGKALQVTETGKESFEADFVSGGQLRMHIRSGDLRVIGSDENKIRVNYSGKNGSKTNDVTVRLKTIGNYADVEIHAGDMILGVGKADDYGHVDASVNAGDLDAQPFGVSKGGLFRSFDKHGGGKYRLHAHVGAGDLVLRE